MAALGDKASSNPVADFYVPTDLSLPSSDARSVERDYVEHRNAVMAMLRSDFPRLRDPEELYHEAWAELLELRARGEVVRNVRALLKKIAWRRAADQVRKRRPDAVDPTSALIAEEADSAPLPDHQAQVHLDAAALRLVVDSLDERQAAVLKLRFDLQLSAKEIQAELGVSPKRLEKIVTEAYRNVLAQVTEDGAEESPWARRQRSLLLACETGIASSRQRRRAQEMVERDPRCRAMLREMRVALRGVAVVLPMPVLEKGHDPRRLEVLFARLQELLPGWARPSGGSTALRDLQLANPAEHIGTGTGLLAGVGLTAKVLGTCALVGGSAALCLSVPGSHHRRDEPRSHTASHAAPRSSAALGQATTPVSASAAHTRSPSAATAKASGRHAPATSSPKSSSPPSPAPSGSTEFGTGGTGSAQTPASPASAPKDGGGEFGP